MAPLLKSWPLKRMVRDSDQHIAQFSWVLPLVLFYKLIQKAWARESRKK